MAMLNYLIELSHVASKMALKHFRNVCPEDFHRKGRSDFVSFVDQQIEGELRARIHTHYPDHVIIGEEFKHAGTLPDGPCWIIDPIDGTTNFMRGIPQFATSIAFCERGAEPRYGAVIDPVRQEIFLAERGAGLWINEQRVNTSGHTSLDDALVACALPFRTMHSLPEVMQVMEALQNDIGDVRRMGAASLDLAYTAVGRLDAYWELGIWPWDTAAGELLVRAGGGSAYDFRGESGHLLGRRSVIAGSTELLTQQLLARIGPKLAHWLDDPAYLGFDAAC